MRCALPTTRRGRSTGAHEEAGPPEALAQKRALHVRISGRPFDPSAFTLRAGATGAGPDRVPRPGPGATVTADGVAGRPGPRRPDPSGSPARCGARPGGYPRKVIVTTDRLRELFDSPLADPCLVVVEGEARVVSATADEDQGLFVATRSELLEQHGGTAPSGKALEELARNLTTSVDTLGG